MSRFMLRCSSLSIRLLFLLSNLSTIIITLIFFRRKNQYEIYIAARTNASFRQKYFIQSSCEIVFRIQHGKGSGMIEYHSGLKFDFFMLRLQSHTH